MNRALQQLCCQNFLWANLYRNRWSTAFTGADSCGLVEFRQRHCAELSPGEATTVALPDESFEFVLTIKDRLQEPRAGCSVSVRENFERKLSGFDDQGPYSIVFEGSTVVLPNAEGRVTTIQNQAATSTSSGSSRISTFGLEKTDLRASLSVRRNSNDAVACLWHNQVANNTAEVLQYAEELEEERLSFGADEKFHNTVPFDSPLADPCSPNEGQHMGFAIGVVLQDPKRMRGRVSYQWPPQKVCFSGLLYGFYEGLLLVDDALVEATSVADINWHFC